MLPMAQNLPLTWLQVSQLLGESCTILAAAGPHLKNRLPFLSPFTLPPPLNLSVWGSPRASEKDGLEEKKNTRN